MEEKNKKILKRMFSFQLNINDLLPASIEDRKQQIKMRESTSFFKDGMKRLLKNKVSMTCLFALLFIILAVIFVPIVWPYSYEQQLGVTKGQSVDSSYNNLKMFQYGTTELIQNAKHKNGLDKTTGENGPVEYRVNEDKIEWKYVSESTWQELIGFYDLALSKNYKKKNGEIEYSINSTKSGWIQWRYIAEEKEWTKIMNEDQFSPEYKNAIDSGNIISYQINVENSCLEWKDSTQEDYSFLASIESLPTGMQNLIARNSNIEYQIIDGSLNYREKILNVWQNLINIGLIKNISGEKVFPHLFGTDSAGRDFFIRVIYGARVSLAVGFFASIIVLIIGTLYGSISGYFGGKIDLFMMRIVDTIYALPDMLIIILLSVVLNEIFDETLQNTVFASLGANMISIFIVFGLFYWVSMARLIRGQILSLKEQEYILAAKSVGAKPSRIIIKHLLPNCISVIIISTALQIPSAIFTESFLSFLGLGVASPMPSLGSLASDALSGVYSYTYRLIIPAAMICLIVLSLNLLGDGLRDAFDPKLNN